MGLSVRRKGERGKLALGEAAAACLPVQGLGVGGVPASP